MVKIKFYINIKKLDLVQKKLRLVKTQQNTAGPKMLGIVKLMPNLQELTFSSWTEKNISMK